ncbi:MAG: uncharacterized protein KVP18_000303 [Porospora cf. gigantea A]|uniref:uncharacterized protein n=1 Tax=Porospora cf. gigantea A TaxID=2853593 RepID=UPI00355A7918|nr:MAG: hypothetical protein KVP18_000303 [Porospora cf. gigantea A]
MSRNPVSSSWAVGSRYVKRAAIGSGSYGSVCEFYDTQNEEVVAIKRIHKVFEDLIDAKRILREIAILRRMDSPYIVGLKDIIVPEDPKTFNELYIVLQLSDSDLKKIARTDATLEDCSVARMVFDLLVGLQYVHDCGVLHRDLKPANCLVNVDGHVRICDFGLARTITTNQDEAVELSYDEEEDLTERSVRDENARMKLTQHVVTRWYRAPELILLQDNYNEAIDVWSVGCIMAELLGMNLKNVRSWRDRQPLFPGQCCYPLSPDHKTRNTSRFASRGARDQLHMIFNQVGLPTDEDLAALRLKDAKAYVKNLVATMGEKVECDAKKTLAAKYPASSEQAIDLLAKMLIFNPNKRITVAEAIKHPFLREARRHAEKDAVKTTAPIVIPFDDWTPMKERELRYAFLAEIKAFHDFKMPRSLQKIGYGQACNPDYVTEPERGLPPPATAAEAEKAGRMQQLKRFLSTKQEPTEKADQPERRNKATDKPRQHPKARPVTRSRGPNWMPGA